LQEFTAGRNAVVIIDEAQNLAPRVLEQLRMLSNLETERGKLVQVILVGQPELRDKLATPQMRQLDQRIAVRFHIHGLTRQEIQPYLTHRLSVAGGANAVTFTRRALTLLHRSCEGIPRRLNLLCDRSLLTAYVRGTRRVTARIIRQSMRDLGGSWPAAARRRLSWRLVLRRVTVAGGFCLGSLGILSSVLFLPGVQERFGLPSPQQVLARIQPPTTPPPVPMINTPPVSPTLAVASTASLSLAQQPLLHFTETDLHLARVLWQLKLQAESHPLRPLTATAGQWEAPLRQAASLGGLEVLPLQTGFAQLTHVLRPCFMEVVPEAVPPQTGLWVLVKGLADQILIYREPEGLIAMPLQHLRRIWSGKLYLTLEEGKYRGTIVKQGMQGAQVQAIQMVLKDLGYLADVPSGRFDAPTLQAVKGFQRDYQLVVDGHVGRQTLMVLWHFGGHILGETT
jgi:general secretion pathway protein A